MLRFPKFLKNLISRAINTTGKLFVYLYNSTVIPEYVSYILETTRQKHCTMFFDLNPRLILRSLLVQKYTTKQKYIFK